MTVADRLAPYRDADNILRKDLERYCRNLVRIQTKTGELAPLIWNEPQRQLHAKLERQLESRGLVRAIVLKARRLGISTYVGARFYHRTTLWPGNNAYILTHLDDSTDALFGLVKRVHEHMPADYRPGTVAANAHELAFAGYDGGYRVGTAKNISGLGRGTTLQLFHGSEVAFWSHAETHFSGVMKAVSLVAGTEMILESTAHGVGGEFYNQWGLAERGQSDFIPIFLPWFIDPGNVRALDAGYEPSLAEEEYQRLYGLTDEQLCWAHFDNINNCGGEPGKFSLMFRQENPACAAEAFQTTGADSFIPSEAILRARRIELPEVRELPRVMGVDVARGGADRTRIVDRQGRKAGRINEVMHTDDLTQVANKIMRLLRDNPDIRRAYIDITGGMGAGPYDICRANGFETRVAGINFSSEAMDSQRFANKRAEMWGLMREWLLDPGGADIPDDDEAHRHLAAPEHIPPDSNSRVKLEPKDRIKKRLGLSPDWGDALALTFAEILPIDMPDERPKWLRDFEDITEPDFMIS